MENTACQGKNQQTSKQFNAIQEKTYYEFRPEFWFDIDFEIESNITAKLLSSCYSHYLEFTRCYSSGYVFYCQRKLINFLSYT